MSGNVAAVVANYEGAHLLPICLDTLAQQSLTPAETIVVDAGSSDESVDVARRHGAQVIETRNLGLGHLYNTGLRATSADLVLLANNDLAFEPACLEQLAAAFDERPTLFAADPMQLDWEGARTIHARTRLTRGPLVRAPIPGLRLDPLIAADDVSSTVAANAGVMLVRRDVFLELGGFDETFFLDFEDLDLCWRAWMRGWESVYVPRARVRHKVGMSAGPTVTPLRLRAGHYNVVRFALKCLPTEAAARVILGQLASLVRAPRVVGGALIAVVRDLPTILRQRRALRPQRKLLDWFLSGQPEAEAPRRA